MGVVRLPVAGSIESRDGTLNKDAKLKNMLAEAIEGKQWAVKRPGVSMATSAITGGLAQGGIWLNGVMYTVVDDTLKFFAAGGGSWDTPSGWAQI